MKITTAVAREMPTPVPAVPGPERAGAAEAVVVMGRV